MSSDLKYEQSNIELRRTKVLELLAQGLRQSEMSDKLGVSPATISLDIQYLRCTAQESIKTHIEEKIPMQFSECETGLKLILRKAHELINNSSRPQDQINAMGLAADIYSKLMDLSTNGAILTKTLRWIAEQKKLTAEEDAQIIEEHFGGKGISSTEDEDITESEEPVPIEQDENLKEDSINE
jgi:DNA-binding transcriptional regulator LsrR (DeoR family)